MFQQLLTGAHSDQGPFRVLSSASKRVHEKVGGRMARRANPNWPHGIVMLSIITVEKAGWRAPVAGH